MAQNPEGIHEPEPADLDDDEAKDPSEPDEGPWTDEGYRNSLGIYDEPKHWKTVDETPPRPSPVYAPVQASRSYFTAAGWVAEAGRTHGETAARRHWVDQVDASTLSCAVYTTACGLRVLGVRQGRSTAFCASCAKARGRGVPQ